MNKKKLQKELVDFRDKFKSYQAVVQEMWTERNRYSSSTKIPQLREEKEKPLREQLIEHWGRLEKYFKKLGLYTEASSYGRSFPIFDSALDSTVFDNPIKGESLKLAVQISIKAVGALGSINENEISKLDRQLPTIFIAHNFAEQNKNIVDTFLDFLKTINAIISSGDEVDTSSVSEKVKQKIDSADIVIGIMTKDEKDSEGKWATSKWIRDELSYALADKGRGIIRLIENGVDTEGRIFGDREYISFDRDNLTNAIIKLSEVLQKKINLK